LIERCTGACGHDIENLALRLFDTAVSDLDGDSRPMGDFLEKAALLSDGLVEDYPRLTGQKYGQDEPWKAGSAAKINEASRIGTEQRKELGGVPDVALPDLGQRFGRDQIHPRVPVLKKANK
jgi:hypothetical protein